MFRARPSIFLVIQIVALGWITSFGVAHGQQALAPFTWDNLAEQWDQLGREGFSGVVLVTRNGETVLHKAYGMANRERKLANDVDTIFAIGSTPIDFTKVGILLLADQGKLKLSDPITKYFDQVPADKQSITIDHLMSGRSGLRNFHDLPGDANPDHTWIDREEAVRRIMAQELLFPPGEGREHSHSAWGLLAAIIEIVSGQTYPEFTREHLFGPAGMKDTGFFGEKYAENRMAVGYGDRSEGEINAPPYWGPTSWLVMGSGGQFSTAGDLRRWVDALREGKILSPASQERYFEGGTHGRVLSGGDMFGFELLYGDGPDSLFVLISNAGPFGGREGWRLLGGAMAQLVSGRPVAKFSLGVVLVVNGPDRVLVDKVMPGSAAERDGLKAGDVLITAGGTPMAPEPMAVLNEYLASGKPITFAVERDGTEHEVVVTPTPR